jgi:hypothetical protein
MTIDEAIKDIKENIQPSVGGLSLEMAIQALEEIEEYRVKEFQCHLAQQEGIFIGYNKAIDEFIAIMEEWNDNIKSIRNEDAFFTIENIRKVAEQMKAGAV